MMYTTRQTNRRELVTSAVLAGVLLLGAVNSALAQSAPRAQFQIDATEAYVNEAFTATLTIEWIEQASSNANLRQNDAATIDPPMLPDLPNCSVQLSPEVNRGTSVQGINGRFTRRESRTYHYEITPQRAGVLEIPGFAVTVGGKQIPVRGERIRVVEDTSAARLFMTITSPAERIYVGQHVPVTLSMFALVPEYRGQSLPIKSVFRLMDVATGRFPADQMRGELVARRDPAGRAGTYYHYYVSTALTFDRPGAPVFDDIVGQYYYPVQWRSDPFGSPRITNSRRARAIADVQLPEVQPLPTGDQPAGFTGAVGRFQIHTVASPTDVRVGDPIELRIEISGDGPLETLPPPEIIAQPEITTNFRVPDEELAGSMQRGNRVFTQILRAAHENVTEVPAIKYPYFDPVRGAYRVAESNPIPLDVQAGEQLEAADLAFGETTEETPAADQLTLRDGLRGNVTDARLLLRRPRPVTLTATLTATLAPPVAFGAFALAFGLRTNRNELARRRAAAHSQTRAMLASASATTPTEVAAAARNAMATYLADRLAQPPARFTSAASMAELERFGAAPQTIERCAALMQRCDEAAFAGVAASDSLTADTAALIDELERELRG